MRRLRCAAAMQARGTNCELGSRAPDQRRLASALSAKEQGSRLRAHGRIIVGKQRRLGKRARCVRTAGAARRTVGHGRQGTAARPDGGGPPRRSSGGALPLGCPRLDRRAPKREQSPRVRGRSLLGREPRARRTAGSSSVSRPSRTARLVASALSTARSRALLPRNCGAPLAQDRDQRSRIRAADVQDRSDGEIAPTRPAP
jgi:hypothetical protein